LDTESNVEKKEIRLVKNSDQRQERKSVDSLVSSKEDWKARNSVDLLGNRWANLSVSQPVVLTVLCMYNLSVANWGVWKEEKSVRSLDNPSVKAMVTRKGNQTVEPWAVHWDNSKERSSDQQMEIPRAKTMFDWSELLKVDWWELLSVRLSVEKWDKWSVKPPAYKLVD
jgi:hypothetical protein